MGWGGWGDEKMCEEICAGGEWDVKGVFVVSSHV